MEKVCRIFSVSMLCADFAGVESGVGDLEVDEYSNNFWSTRFCQDINHSLYCTFYDLKTEIIENTECSKQDSTLDLIANYLRPFLAKWHPVFFCPKYSTGRTLSTIPLKRVKKKDRLRFKQDFFELKNSVYRRFFG